MNYAFVGQSRQRPSPWHIPKHLHDLSMAPSNPIAQCLQCGLFIDVCVGLRNDLEAVCAVRGLHSIDVGDLFSRNVCDLIVAGIRCPRGVVSHNFLIPGVCIRARNVWVYWWSSGINGGGGIHRRGGCRCGGLRWSGLWRHTRTIEFTGSHRSSTARGQDKVAIVRKSQSGRCSRCKGAVPREVSGRKNTTSKDPGRW